MRRLSDKEKEQVLYLIRSAQDYYVSDSEGNRYKQEDFMKKYLCAFQMHVTIFSKFVKELGLVDHNVDERLALEKDDDLLDCYDISETISWAIFNCLELCRWNVDASSLWDFFSTISDQELEYSDEGISDFWEQNEYLIKEYFMQTDLSFSYEYGGELDTIESLYKETATYVQMGHKRLGNVLAYATEAEKKELVTLASNTCYILTLQTFFPYISGLGSDGVFMGKMIYGEWIDGDAASLFPYDWSCMWYAILLIDEIDRLEEKYAIH